MKRKISTQKYEGEHVFVVKNKISALKEGKSSLEEFKRLKKGTESPPVLVFAPRSDISYILTNVKS